MDNIKINVPKNYPLFCERQLTKENSICPEYHKSCSDGFSICPYGFSCYKTDSEFYYGFKIKGYFNEKKINGHDRNLKTITELSVFTKEDFLEYIKPVKDIEYSELIKKHEIYRSTIHDIKKAISSIRDVVAEIDFDNDQKSIVDGYDLISTRLDYHDRILMGEQATDIYGKIKPHKLIKKLTILLSYKANSKNITFTFKGSPNIEIYDDSKGIFILFFILLENSVKYSPTDSNIVIELSDINKITTSVKIDNICNDILQNDIEHIFENGFRGSNSKQNAGNGIGLNVAKQIMEKNHIKYCVSLTIDDNENTHFVFYLELPSLDKKGNIYKIK